MLQQHSARVESPPARRYRSPDIPLAVIRRYARQIAERFQPDKIILFGSYANGTPHQDSDVDLLVVMPCANHVSQAVRIRLDLHAPLPMDLLVRTPEKLRRRIEDGNWFLREITEKGKVLYAKRNQSMGTQGRVGPRRRKTDRRRKTASP